MNWEFKTYKTLNTDELYDLLKLRVEVFVVEQNCAYSEIDDKDRHPETLHLLGKDTTHTILAYLRILPPGLSFEQASIGRVVVAKKERRQGVSHKMVEMAIQEIYRAWPGSNVKIGAQAYLKLFYESFGFITVTDTYLDDGIPHIDMVLKKNHP